MCKKIIINTLRKKITGSVDFCLCIKYTYIKERCKYVNKF